MAGDPDAAGAGHCDCGRAGIPRRVGPGSLALGLEPGLEHPLAGGVDATGAGRRRRFADGLAGQSASRLAAPLPGRHRADLPVHGARRIRRLSRSLSRLGALLCRAGRRRRHCYPAGGVPLAAERPSLASVPAGRFGVERDWRHRHRTAAAATARSDLRHAGLAAARWLFADLPV